MGIDITAYAMVKAFQSAQHSSRYKEELQGLTNPLNYMDTDIPKPNLFRAGLASDRNNFASIPTAVVLETNSRSRSHNLV